MKPMHSTVQKLEPRGTDGQTDRWTDGQTGDASLRTAGTKSTLVRAFKREIQMNTVSHLLWGQLKTAMVLDAIFVICQWSFHKSETFEAIARQYLQYMLDKILEGTLSNHFCSD